MSKKIINLPNKYKRSKRLSSQNGKIICEVSERWIQFGEYSDKYSDIDYLSLDIMTKSIKEKDKKICGLIVDRDILLSLLQDLPTNNHIEKN